MTSPFDPGFDPIPDLDEDDDDVESEDDDEDNYETPVESLTSIAASLELDTQWEDIPRNSYREGTVVDLANVPWETMLGKCRDNPLRSMRLWTFDHPTAKAMANSKARKIRMRLFWVVPQEQWRVVARSPEEGVWGVYVQYVKVLDEKEVAVKMAKYKSQLERLEMARAARGF